MVNVRLNQFMHGTNRRKNLLAVLGTWKIMPFADLGPSSTDENKIPPKQDHPQDKSGTTDLDIAHAQKRRNEEKVQSMFLQVLEPQNTNFQRPAKSQQYVWWRHR